MKKRNRWIALLLGIMMVFTFIPTIAFADDEEDYYNATATYNGLPEFYYFDDSDFWAQEGDSITVNYNGVSTTYVVEEFRNQEPYEGWDFWTDKNIIHNPDDPYDIVFYWVDIEDQKATLYLNKYDEEEDWRARIVFDGDDIDISNSVDKITFKPNAVTLYSEDIKETYADGSYDYKLEKRAVHSMNGQTWESPFCVGDQLIVYQDNRATTYTNADIDTDDYPELEADYKYEDYFVSADKKEIFYLPYTYGNEDEYLKPGNNTITFYYHGRTTTMNVFVETPESRAADKAKKEDEAAKAKAKAEAEADAKARADEAERQGTQDSGMPSMKFKKTTAKKSSIKVQWAKLNKKKVKKSKTSKIEVWVSTSSAFPKGQTIEKTIGKNKTSVNIKGLQKNTKYFVKIRSIKYVNGKKMTGPWKQKTVKTKKK